MHGDGMLRRLFRTLVWPVDVGPFQQPLRPHSHSRAPQGRKYRVGIQLRTIPKGVYDGYLEPLFSLVNCSTLESKQNVPKSGLFRL